MILSRLRPTHPGGAYRRRLVATSTSQPFEQVTKLLGMAFSGPPNLAATKLIGEAWTGTPNEGVTKLLGMVWLYPAVPPCVIGNFPSLVQAPGAQVWLAKRTPVFATPQFQTFAGRESFAWQQRVPTWRFTVPVEFMRDQTQNQTPYGGTLGFTELQAVMGLYQWCSGSAGPFYFDYPPDDSRLGQTIAVGDGFTATFTVPREPRQQAWATTLSAAVLSGATALPVVSIFGFSLGDRITVALTGGGTSEVQISGFQASPPQINLTTGISGAAASGNAVTDLLVEPVGAVNQNQAFTVYLNGVAQSGSSYTISGNQLIFNSSPAADVAITMDFWFYYLCHFMEDRLPFHEFMKNLWQSPQVKFETIPKC